MVGGGTRRGGVVWCRVCDVATVTGTGTGAGVAWCGDVAVLKWSFWRLGVIE